MIPSPAPVLRPVTQTDTVSYAVDIMHMMHGLGDGSKQNPDSGHLIEEIVGQQMNSLLVQAFEVSVMRSSGSIGLPEILFLMRKDRLKLLRLLKHLSFKDSLSATVSNMQGTMQSLVTSSPAHAVHQVSRGFVDLVSLASNNGSDQTQNGITTMTMTGSSAGSLVDGVVVDHQANQHVSHAHQHHQQHPHHEAGFGTTASSGTTTPTTPGTSLLQSQLMQQQHHQPSQQDPQPQHHPSSLTLSSSEQTSSGVVVQADEPASSSPAAPHAINLMMHPQHHPHQPNHHHQQMPPGTQATHVMPGSAGGPATKRLKICMDFLRSTLDESGHLIKAFNDDFFDDIKHKRALRREKMTRNMSDQEYQRFHQSRQVSFANKARPSKFRDWLSQQTRDSGLPSDLKINDFAMEVLQYLAFETVAELVDMCLLVKQDAGKMASDPVHNLTRLHKPLPPTGIVNRTRSGIEDTTLKRKRQQDEEAMAEGIQPKHVREVMRRFMSPSGLFSLSESAVHPRNRLSPSAKRLVVL